MNFSSFIGRLSPSLFANYVPAEYIIAVSTSGCSILVFGMIGVKSIAGVVVFGVIYGFFAGICKTYFLSSLMLTSLTASLFRPYILQTLQCWHPC
jgi:hypothetical protein